MEAGHDSVVQLLGPVLDTYMDSAVGLIGCRASGLARPSCEYDVVLVGIERLPPNSIKVGSEFFDLLFLTEEEAAKPPTAELAIALSSAKPVRDTTLVLSSCSTAAHDSFPQSCQRSADEHLASSLKAMGRAEEAVSKDAFADADFWLASAGYDFAYAWLTAAKTIPSPSHLLSQLRQHSRGQPGMFEAFSGSVGLKGASRRSCEERLDSLGVIYDLKEAPSLGRDTPSPESVRTSYELLRVKSMSTQRASQPADSYCYLGLEMVRSLPQVLRNRLGRKESSDVVSSLTGGEDGLLAPSVVKTLGIGRPPDAVRKGLEALRVQVSTLVRKG